MADNDLVSKFLDALRENGQQHVVRILVPEGLNMSVMLFCLFNRVIATVKILSQYVIIG